MRAIVFDLDGTLVDSAPSILSSFGRAFADCGLHPNEPLTSALIGRPLRDTLARLCGDVCDSAKLDSLMAAFKRHYDSVGYRETRPFDGIGAMLKILSDAGLELHIATNKRALPTRLILEHLDWTELFDRVYALDTFDPPLPHKTALLARLLVDAGLGTEDCAYVGDRADDALAARDNGLRFFWAAWGFSSENVTIDEQVIALDRPDATRLLCHR